MGPKDLQFVHLEDLNGKDPSPLASSSHLIALRDSRQSVSFPRLSQKLGVPVSADTLGVRQVLQQQLLGTGSDAPPGPAALSGAAPQDGSGLPKPLPLRTAKARWVGFGSQFGHLLWTVLTVVWGSFIGNGWSLKVVAFVDGYQVNYNNLLTSSHRFPPVLRYGHVGYVKHGGGQVWLDAAPRPEQNDTATTTVWATGPLACGLRSCMWTVTSRNSMH